MTRKQYVSKMRQFQRIIAKHAKETGLKVPKTVDRVNKPLWGQTILIGPHKGERLISYAQAWNTVEYALKGTSILEEIH